jgi:predicted glycosyltransferase
MLSKRKKLIWIDLDNTPHVVFFQPIIEDLKARGFELVLTARNCFQVCGLADHFNLQYNKIGRHYGKNKFIKVLGLFFRSFQMLPFVIKNKPGLALSHGSRSQLFLSNLLGITSILIGDYEHAKWLPAGHPKWLIIPDIIPDKSIFIDKTRVIRYPGIKENVYLPRFKPDPAILDELGINSNNLIATIRPPATYAHYHNPESEQLFYAAVDHLGQKRGLKIVILPRDIDQENVIRKMWPDMCSDRKVIIPDHVVDGLDLLWYSDLVISGGGTMNREAAALGVPVYSIFRGKIGAVDRHLSDCGRLTLLESADDVRTKVALKRWQRPDKPENANNVTLKSIVESIIDVYKKTENVQQ